MTFQEFAVPSDQVVAYGFQLSEDEHVRAPHNNYIQLFHTASDARKALACTTHEVQVLVVERTKMDAALDFEVSPLNLVAALHKDNPLRDIYLEATDPNSLFVSRTQAAGARGVVAQGDIEHLLCLRGTEEAKSAQVSTKAEIPVDTEWLEQVLALDELDEPISCSVSTLLERSPLLTEVAPVHHPAASEQVFINTQQSQEKGVVAAFVSGRGGVGKSSLSILTAFELWRSGSRVVVLDMDLQFGDIGMLAGNEPESHLLRLNLEQLYSEAVRIPPLEGALLLLEAPARPEMAEELVPLIPRLLAELRDVADIVLINTACLWNEATAVLASGADKLIICMDQRATSLSAARQVVDLCIRLQIPSTRLYYLLNRSARNAPITNIDASLAMGGVEVVTIAEAGSDVDELLSLGCPLELLSAASGLRQSIHKLGMQLLAKPGSETSGRGGSR